MNTLDKCAGCGSDQVSAEYGRDDKVECDACGGFTMASPFDGSAHFVPAKTIRAARRAEAMVRNPLDGDA